MVPFSRNNPTWPKKWGSFGRKIQHVPKICFFSFFCWSVESCWIRRSNNVLLSAEMLNRLNMLNYFWSMGSQKGPNRGNIIEHIQHFSWNMFFWKGHFNMIQHIQHLSRKKHFFGKGIQHDLTYSTFQQKEAIFWTKSLFQGKIQHRRKSGSFSRTNSTWPKSGSFSRKNSTWPQK